MGVLTARRAWFGAFAASLAMHAGVAAVLWTTQRNAASRATDQDASVVDIAFVMSALPTESSPGAQAASALDAIVEQSESIEEQLPAHFEEPSAMVPAASDEFVQPIRPGTDQHAPQAQLLPPNTADAMHRQLLRDQLATALRAARGLVADSVAALTSRSVRRGARDGNGSGNTGVDAVASQSGPACLPPGIRTGIRTGIPTGLPSRGPSLAEGNRPPEYPEELRRARVEGTAWVRVVIGADGRVSSASIAKGSGSPQLDALALEAVRAWHFNAALESGVPVRSEADLPVVFRIRAR